MRAPKRRSPLRTLWIVSVLLPATALALSALDDSCDDAASLADWSVFGGSLATTLDIDTTFPGHLAIEPLASFWWQAQEAPLLSQLVSGDFAMQATVRARLASDPS
jgi:hypothetical protein